MKIGTEFLVKKDHKISDDLYLLKNTRFKIISKHLNCEDYRVCFDINGSEWIQILNKDTINYYGEPIRTKSR